MVQGYTRSSARQNPYYYNEDRLPPSSHGVRQNIPEERGKGWQRTKSNMRDYRSSSDICFNEESVIPKKGYGSNGRPRNSHSDEIYYRKERRPMSSQEKYQSQQTFQRRRSMDARQKPTKPCPSQVCTKVPTKPMQKRVATCPPPKYIQHCVTGDDEFVGFTTIKDLKYLPKETGMREGPKPKKYIQKLNTVHVDHDFPKVNDDDEERFKCDKRKLEMLVKTGDFVEYGYCEDPIRWDTHLTNELKPLQFSGVYEPMMGDKLFDTLEQVRMEFTENTLNEDSEIVGRIYMKINNECRVDFLKLDINQIYSVSKVNGKNLDNTKTTKVMVLPTDSAERIKEDYMIPEKINHKILLPPGAHAIPFTLKVSKNRPPSIVQVRAENGDMALNCYTIAATFKINNTVGETDRVTFNIPLPPNVKKEQLKLTENNVVVLGSSGKEVRDGNYL